MDSIIAQSVELICKFHEENSSKMKPVAQLRRNHPRIVLVEPADGDRVVQQHAVIGYVQH